MIIYTNEKDFKYELEKLCRIFLPFEKITFEHPVDCISGDNYAVIESADGRKRFNCTLKLDGRLQKRNKDLPLSADSDTAELTAALLLFDCFTAVTGYTSPWGILTGVRPAKLMGRLISEMGQERAVKYFKDTLLVSDSKTELCLSCRIGEDHAVSLSRPDDFSLYISVPFCPSRCSYCSFVSHSVEQAKKLIPQYVKLLCEELRVTAEYAKRSGLSLRTVYIGGGTPTTLSPEQLTMVMDTVKDSFSLEGLLEYTVEAGRPDTVTAEKLAVIKSGGATRISINPQTMNDGVLQKIGRRHTVQQMLDAFYLAREQGFDNINTDLIAGLTGDTLESFKSTVDQIIDLSPENVTVHSLSMKRASNLAALKGVFDSAASASVGDMVEYARSALCDAGIKPYYMYRQSKTVGNLENVGYAKQGFEGLYNIYIMDETHSILACGASAVTKLREPGGNYIERIFNYKYPYEYISRFEEVLRRKEGILSFYEKYPADLSHNKD